MGAEKTQTGGNYYTVMYSHFARKVKEGTPDAECRENKNGIKVYELSFDTLSGTLSKISFRDGDYGKEIHFTLKDGKDVEILQLQYTSRIAKSYIMALPNVNLNEPLKLKIGHDKEKDRAFGWIVQGKDETGKDMTVKSNYTKDRPNGLPPMEKAEFTGKWNDEKQMLFLDNMLKTQIIPKLQHQVETIVEEQDELPIPEDDNAPPITDNDLLW